MFKKKIKLNKYKKTKKFNIQIKKKEGKLRSSLVWNKKTALSFHDLRFYQAEQDRLNLLSTLDKEKEDLSTTNKGSVSEILDKYLEKAKNEEIGVFKILEKIKDRNIQTLLGKKVAIKHDDILSLVAHPKMLLAAYRTIRKNKGALTQAYPLPSNIFLNLTKEQQSLLRNSWLLPDGMNNELLIWVSHSIKKGTYIWGSSRRIWIDKPGAPKGSKKRPITIPPFVDRMVQESIRMVLEAIYEPEMVRQNCSFGFRASCSTHDNIVSITEPRKTASFTTAIEGDLQEAYPNLDRKILLKILSEKIGDKKFLKFMEQRLALLVYDTDTEKYQESIIGIPQGGIDSPYLWNIYLMGMDDFLKTHLATKLGEINKKRGFLEKRKVNPANPITRKFENQIQCEKDKLKTYKRNLKVALAKEKSSSLSLEEMEALEMKKKEAEQVTARRRRRNNIIVRGGSSLNMKGRFFSIDHEQRTYMSETTLDYLIHFGLESNHIDNTFTSRQIYKQIFIITNRIRLIRHAKRQVRSKDIRKECLRFHYSRYADDFVILGNFDKHLAKEIKNDLSVWLLKERAAILSDKKTIITDLKKNPCHFLGFEIIASNTRRLKYVIQNGKRILRRTAGWFLRAYPDRQRLINRLHMKGYCDKMGFPIHIPWLSGLEPHIIVDKFRSVMVGFANFYVDYIYTPSSLSRWLYIIRWSCFKTLAQKYNTTVRKVMEKFMDSKGNFSVAYRCKLKDKDNNIVTLEKKWILPKESETIRAAQKGRNKSISKKLLRIEQGAFPSFVKSPGRTPRIMDGIFLNSINWVNFRTQANLDLPCFICGSTTEVQMHHINPIRKRKYSLIPLEESWKKVMALRNRKQIPVCSFHHRLIHSGLYNSKGLRSVFNSPLLL